MLLTGMKPQHEGFRHCVVPSCTKAILQLPMRSRLQLLERNVMKNRSAMQEHRDHIEGVQEARRRAQQLQVSTPAEFTERLHPESQGTPSHAALQAPMAQGTSSAGHRATKANTPRTPREALPLVCAGETLLESPRRVSSMPEDVLGLDRALPQQGILNIRLRHLEAVAHGHAQMLESHRQYLDEHARQKRREQL
mmetsp:Transcript_22737/g.51910  ORF Transcript_22737/g.51910 Transcript_22737/m.51910 type:complete len:195 (-) Transcript_22737:50-634(-)